MDVLAAAAVVFGLLAAAAVASLVWLERKQAAYRARTRAHALDVFPHLLDDPRRAPRRPEAEPVVIVRTIDPDLLPPQPLKVTEVFL